MVHDRFEPPSGRWENPEGIGGLDLLYLRVRFDVSFFMLMLRRSVDPEWAPRVTRSLHDLLVDHAHLERKAATTAIQLEKYRELFPKVHTLNRIAMEELQHFELVLGLLEQRNWAFGQPQRSEWITGMMRGVRQGRRESAIDHLVVCALIEGRSCEKFQILAAYLAKNEPELSLFYQSLVESEGNHYATYLIMARDIDLEETDSRLDWFLDRDSELMDHRHDLCILH
jgi:tRNA 2-(methylsulfanyl)-N6-isopentenyladenosine37 hydroxylase